MSLSVLRVAFVLALTLTSVTPALAQRLSHQGIFGMRGQIMDEGCNAVYRTTRPVTAHAQPNSTSSVVRTVDANRRIEGNDYNDVFTVTLRPGRTRVTDPGPALALAHGRITYLNRASSGRETTLTLRRGQTIELLAYEGEEWFIVRIDGEVYSMSPPRAEGAWTMPTEETWVRLVPRAGRPAGWVNVSARSIVADECSGD